MESFFVTLFLKFDFYYSNSWWRGWSWSSNYGKYDDKDDEKKHEEETHDDENNHDYNTMVVMESFQQAAFCSAFTFYSNWSCATMIRRGMMETPILPKGDPWWWFSIDLCIIGVCLSQHQKTDKNSMMGRQQFVGRHYLMGWNDLKWAEESEFPRQELEVHRKDDDDDGRDPSDLNPPPRKIHIKESQIAIPPSPNTSSSAKIERWKAEWNCDLSQPIRLKDEIETIVQQLFCSKSNNY